MSEAITKTTVLLAGTREAIIRILNRAFRVCSGGDKIADGDECTLRIVSRVREDQRTYYPEDWHYWCAMVSITDDCLISFKVDRE